MDKRERAGGREGGREGQKASTACHERDYDLVGQASCTTTPFPPRGCSTPGVAKCRPSGKAAWL